MTDRSDPHGVAQAEYHRELFGALWDVPPGADEDGAGPRGLDLLGHWGGAGCALVVEAIAEHVPPWPLTVVELGSGLGGVLRRVVADLPDGVRVARAVGVELVADQVRAARAATPAGMHLVCGDVARPGLRSGRFDVVFATGSVSHFPDMASVLREAYRLLRPGGLLTFTEEASLLTGSAEPGEAFCRTHPENVFARATVAERERQLEAAGFTGIEVRDVTQWAVRTLRERGMAMRIQRSRLAEIYGAEQSRILAETTAALQAELAGGALTAAHVVALRPCEGGG